MSYPYRAARLSILILAAWGAEAPAMARMPEPGDSAPSFTRAQSAAGEGLYAVHCATCHGDQLQGISGPSLQGSRFANAWMNGQKTAGDLDRLIQRTMPLSAPHSLSDEQYSQIIAYLLAQNGYQPGASAYGPATAAAILEPPAGVRPAALTARPRLPQLPASVAPASSHRPDDAELASPGEAGWLMYNKDYDGQRYSSLDQINTRNAGTLVPRCIYQLGEVGSFQASPVIYDKTLYVTTGYNTYAIDATTCGKLWSSTYPPDRTPPVLVSRGVAIYRGKLFRVTPNGHLLALDSKTGKVLWDVWMSDEAHGYWLSAAPIAYDGKVFIGEAGADWGANAHIYAFDTETGKRVWTFDVIPTGKQSGADSWERGAERGGGSMWSSLTLDPDRRQLYFSVGNPAPDFNGAMRPGDNLFTDSVVVLDERTGALQWYVQQVPHDVHDADTAAAPILYTQGGRRYMAVANKGGWLYIYDGDTHRLLAKTEVSPHENIDKPITVEGIHVCPGVSGGVEWNGPAYSPKLGLLYVNSLHWCTTLRLTENRYIEGSSYFDGEYTLDPVDQAKGFTRAIDAVTGKQVWSRVSPAPMLAGLTPTGGNIVFTGDLNGDFLVLDGKTGDVLYRFATGGAVAGGISTYAIDGKQYVAVASGNNSRTIWRTTGAATVVIFALGGS